MKNIYQNEAQFFRTNMLQLDRFSRDLTATLKPFPELDERPRQPLPSDEEIDGMYEEAQSDSQNFRDAK